MGSLELLADLIAVLSTGDPDERRWADVDLSARPDALTALINARTTERDPVVADAIFTALTQQDGPEAGRALATDLRSDDATVRSAAVRALGAMPVAVEALVEDGILLDEDPDVRILVLTVLGTLAHPSVLSWVAPVVEQAPEANVVSTAVDAAINAAGEDARGLAEVAARRFPDNPYLRFLASRSVAQ